MCVWWPHRRKGHSTDTTLNTAGPWDRLPREAGHLHSWRMSNLNRTRLWLIWSNLKLATFWAKVWGAFPTQLAFCESLKNTRSLQKYSTSRLAVCWIPHWTICCAIISLVVWYQMQELQRLGLISQQCCQEIQETMQLLSGCSHFYK